MGESRELHTRNLKLFLKRESLRGDRGEVGFELERKEVLVLLGVLLLVLHSSSLGLSWSSMELWVEITG